MDMENLIQELQQKLVQFISAADLDSVLNQSEIILEKDTLISGFIRILKYENYFITQETTDKNEVVLRLFKKRKDAEALVQDHLETYDMMWDGCGCKVNYYS